MITEDKEISYEEALRRCKPSLHTCEIWKDIKGYEGKYQVSSHGRIRSLNYHNTGQCKILKTATDGKGYLRCALSKNNRLATYKVHRLVALHFIENPNQYKQVNHKNGCKSDNLYTNLEWCNNSQNAKHAWDIGIQPNSRRRKLYKFEGYIKYCLNHGCSLGFIDKELSVSYGSTKRYLKKHGLGDYIKLATHKNSVPITAFNSKDTLKFKSISEASSYFGINIKTMESIIYRHYSYMGFKIKRTALPLSYNQWIKSTEIRL